jgi:cytoskeletal protein RodZ
MVKLGQRLRQERTARNLTIEEAARDTKIKASFLTAIEKGDYQKLPSPAYAKGFVKNYAAYLGLPKAEVAAFFRREFDEKRAYKVLPDSLTKTEEFPLKRLRIQQSLVIAAGLLILFVGYLLFQYRYAFLPPSIDITSPKEDAVVSQDVTVTGTTDSEATVVVNNEPVSLSPDGKFKKNLTLFPGKNVITVKAKNRAGKEAVLEREITVR